MADAEDAVIMAMTTAGMSDFIDCTCKWIRRPEGESPLPCNRSMPALHPVRTLTCHRTDHNRHEAGATHASAVTTPHASVPQ